MLQNLLVRNIAEARETANANRTSLCENTNDVLNDLRRRGDVTRVTLDVENTLCQLTTLGSEDG